MLDQIKPAVENPENCVVRKLHWNKLIDTLSRIQIADRRDQAGILDFSGLQIDVPGRAELYFEVMPCAPPLWRRRTRSRPGDPAMSANSPPDRIRPAPGQACIPSGGRVYLGLCACGFAGNQRLTIWLMNRIALVPSQMTEQ